MAILLNGTSDYLSLAAAPATGAPMTIAAWVKPGAQVAGERCVITISASGATAQYFTLDDGTGTGAPAAWIAASTSANALATVRTGSGAWSHIAGVYASATSRSAYVNGGSVGSNATNLTPTGQNQSIIGAFKQGGNAVSTFFGGLLADVAIWNVALTVGELAALAAGARPWEIRPSALVACVAGERSVTSDLLGRIWTLNGAPKLVPEMPPLTVPRRQLSTRFRGLLAPIVPINGVLASTISNFTLTATGTVKLQAVDSTTIDNFTLASAGKVKLQATSSTVIDPITLAATGMVKLAGVVSATIDNFVTSSAAALHIGGTSSGIISPFVLSAAGVLPLAAAVGVTLDNFSLLAVGGRPPISGALDLTIDPFLGTETGALKIAGTLSATVGAFTLLASAQLLEKATLGVTFGNFTLSSSAQNVNHGVVAATVGAFSTTSAAALHIGGTSAGLIGPFTLSSVGKIVAHGALGVTLPNFTLVATGHLPRTGILAEAFGNFTLLSVGRHRVPQGQMMMSGF